MRLIDADKILEYMESNLDMQEAYLPISFLDLVIDEMPTIKTYTDKNSIYNQTLERMKRLGINRSDYFNIIVQLSCEIERYRERLQVYLKPPKTNEKEDA